MNIMVLIILLLLCTISPLLLLYEYYKPKIEIIILDKHYKIYLWYNQWKDSEYKGRISKYLFKI